MERRGIDLDELLAKIEDPFARSIAIHLHDLDLMLSRSMGETKDAINGLGDRLGQKIDQQNGRISALEAGKTIRQEMLDKEYTKFQVETIARVGTLEANQGKTQLSLARMLGAAGSFGAALGLVTWLLKFTGS